MDTTDYLVYHHISENDRRIPGQMWDVPVAWFERQMQYLYDHGYHCLSLADAVHADKTNSTRRHKNFVLTFDDGYVNFATLGFPIIEHFGFTATVFIVTDLVGGRSNWGTERDSPLMTWEQIHALEKEAISFGSHTCTHPRLTDLTDEQIRDELIRSKAILEATLYEDHKLFSYPFGASDERTQRLVSEAGYVVGCGMRGGQNGRFNLKRYPIYGDVNLSSFAFKMSPWYRFFNHMREDTLFGQVLRRVKGRISTLR